MKKYLCNGKVITASSKSEVLAKFTKEGNPNDNYLKVIKQVIDAQKQFKIKLGYKDFYIMGAKTKPIFLGGFSIDEIAKLLRTYDLGTKVDIVVRDFSSYVNRDGELGFMKALRNIGFINHFGSYIYSFN